MGNIYFTKEHEWARIEDGIAVCGITDFAQKALGDIVYVELPTAGKKAGQGDQVAVVESSKAASEVYAPVEGEVTEINPALSGDPALVNSAAMGEGWFFKLKIANADQIKQLMDEAAYQDYVKGL